MKQETVSPGVTFGDSPVGVCYFILYVVCICILKPKICSSQLENLKIASAVRKSGF